jgi:hypothetical protein
MSNALWCRATWASWATKPKHEGGSRREAEQQTAAEAALQWFNAKQFALKKSRRKP